MFEGEYAQLFQIFLNFEVLQVFCRCGSWISEGVDTCGTVTCVGHVAWRQLIFARLDEIDKGRYVPFATHPLREVLVLGFGNVQRIFPVMTG
jgi:hypothetical protein